MTEWSEDTKRQTISDLTYKTYTPNGEKVYFKHVSGLFGYMLDDDVLRYHWRLNTQSGDEQVFHSPPELVASGWVLDWQLELADNITLHPRLWLNYRESADNKPNRKRQVCLFGKDMHTSAGGH